MEALECERETLHGSHWSDVFLSTHSQQDPGATLLTGFQAHDVLAGDPTGVPLGSVTVTRLGSGGDRGPASLPAPRRLHLGQSLAVLQCPR